MGGPPGRCMLRSGMSAARSIAVVGLVAGLGPGMVIGVPACRASDAERCTSLAAERRFADAAPRCLQAFRATGRAALGAAAARALWELERDDEVLGLAAELEAAPG